MRHLERRAGQDSTKVLCCSAACTATLFVSPISLVNLSPLLFVFHLSQSCLTALLFDLTPVTFFFSRETIVHNSCSTFFNHFFCFVRAYRFNVVRFVIE